MKIIQGLVQGSPEWHEHRRTKWNASDAPAMLGESPYCSRTELLDRMVTGITPEVDDRTQDRFNDGHAVEALLRPHAEAIVGEPLHPFVAVADFDDRYSASFDGCTFVGDITSECKLLNKRLREAFADMESIAPEHRERGAGKCLPIDYRIQQEQQVRIAGAERSLFLAGELRADGTLGDTFSCWYYPDDALWARIQAGWLQLEADRATHVTHVEAPKPTGRAPESLPALRIELKGEVTASNLAEFKANALAVFAGINRNLTTDAEFADAEKTVKWCGDVEDRLKAAKEHALSQTASIDALFKTIDDISAESRRVRLDLDKLVTARKAAIKQEIVQEGRAAYETHEGALRVECGAWTVLPQPDFAGCIKGLRTVDSIRNAVNTTLANAKIKADEQARTIRAALTALAQESEGFEHLFSDRLTFIGMSPDAVRLTVRDRIARHRAAEEAARLEREQQEKLALEQRQREETEARERREREAAEALARQQAEAAKPAQPPAAPPIAQPEPVSQAVAPSVVVQLQRPAGKPTLRLGQIQERIAPLSITAAGLEQLGFKATKEGAATLYQEADFARMVDSLVAQLRKAAEEFRLAA